MCNGKCTCGREDNKPITETSEKNISEDTAASFDINGVVVD